MSRLGWSPSTVVEMRPLSAARAFELRSDHAVGFLRHKSKVLIGFDRKEAMAGGGSRAPGCLDDHIEGKLGDEREIAGGDEVSPIPRGSCIARGFANPDAARVDAGRFQARRGGFRGQVDRNACIHQRHMPRLSEKALPEPARADDAGFDGAVSLRVMVMEIHGVSLPSGAQGVAGSCAREM